MLQEREIRKRRQSQAYEAFQHEALDSEVLTGNYSDFRNRRGLIMSDVDHSG